jgi:hypothetical protein
MSPTGGEFAFIDWLRRRTPAAGRVLLGPGDDTAILDWPAATPCLVTTDMLLEGSCFLLEEAGPRRVGRKAMAVNLSDIAAMAGRPVAAVVSVGLPRKGGRELAEELYLGLREMADAFDTAVVGGDTNSWDGPLVISVTLLGEATTRGAVRRSGARPTPAPWSKHSRSRASRSWNSANASNGGCGWKNRVGAGPWSRAATSTHWSSTRAIDGLLPGLYEGGTPSEVPTAG